MAVLYTVKVISIFCMGDPKKWSGKRRFYSDSSINRLINRLTNRLIRVGLGIAMCIITAWCYLLILPSVTKLANIRQIILENQKD